jgi:hypothetical protein
MNDDYYDRKSDDAALGRMRADAILKRPSETPRTDAALKFVERGASEEVLAQPDKWLVTVSRELERENTKLREALDTACGFIRLSGRRTLADRLMKAVSEPDSPHP